MRCRTCAASLMGVSPAHELFGVFAALEQWENDSICTQVELPPGHLSLIIADADEGLTPQEAIAATYWCNWMSVSEGESPKPASHLKVRAIVICSRDQMGKGRHILYCPNHKCDDGLGIAELQASAKMSCRQSLHWCNSCPLCLPK